MNKNLIVILAIIIGGSAVGMFYVFMKQYSPEFSWSEQYRTKSEAPYGLSIFYDLIKQGENDIVNIKKNFNNTLDTNTTGTNYVAIGEYLYIDSLRADHILDYVAKGNNALIIAKNAPLEITRMFIYSQDSIYDYTFKLDSVVQVKFVDQHSSQQLSFHYQHLKDTSAYNWSAYSNSYFYDSLYIENFKAVSELNGRVNSYALKWGDGTIIIHSNPILFTNYNIIQEDGFINTNNILSYLNNGDIFWDEMSSRYSNDNNSGSSESNPLQFLFSHYTLRWGWYLFLGTIVVYLLFRTKREQRIIPLLPTNTNSTISYVKAIGVLYFQKGQHQLIANELYTLLLADLRNRYQLNTTVKEPELIEHISAKSGIEKETITALFKHFRKVKYSPIANSKDLINLHNAIAFYYKNCI